MTTLLLLLLDGLTASLSMSVVSAQLQLFPDSKPDFLFNNRPPPTQFSPCTHTRTPGENTRLIQRAVAEKRKEKKPHPCGCGLAEAAGGAASQPAE